MYLPAATCIHNRPACMTTTHDSAKHPGWMEHHCQSWLAQYNMSTKCSSNNLLQTWRATQSALPESLASNCCRSLLSSLFKACCYRTCVKWSSTLCFCKADPNAVVPVDYSTCCLLSTLWACALAVDLRLSWYTWDKLAPSLWVRNRLTFTTQQARVYVLVALHSEVRQCYARMYTWHLYSARFSRGSNQLCAACYMLLFWQTWYIYCNNYAVWSNACTHRLNYWLPYCACIHMWCWLHTRHAWTDQLLVSFLRVSPLTYSNALIVAV